MFRKYRLVPYNVNQSTPTLPTHNPMSMEVTPMAKNDLTVQDAPVTMSGEDEKNADKKGWEDSILLHPQGITAALKASILSGKDPRSEWMGRAKLLFRFLERSGIHTDEDGNILYGGIIGSPLSVMVEFLTQNSTSTDVKRPWDLGKFIKHLKTYQATSGIAIPWDFLGAGKKRFTNRKRSNLSLMTPNDLSKRKKSRGVFAKFKKPSKLGFNWKNVF